MFNQIKKLCSISFLLVLAFFCCSSCRTKTAVISDVVVEKQVARDTVRIEHLLRDSVYIKDSIRIATKNDTVYTERWHTKYIERVKYSDSIVIRRDSIPVEVTITKTETKTYIPKYAKALAFVGMLTILFIAIYILEKLRR